MKFSILGFNQAEVTKLKLDITDTTILRWFINFKDTDKMKSKCIEGEKYYWVRYEYISEDMPILNLKKDSIYRRFKKLCEAKILKHKTIKEGGTWSYFTIDENYKNLLLGYEGYEDADKVIIDRSNNETNPNQNINESTSEDEEEFYNSNEENYDLKEDISVPNESVSELEGELSVLEGELSDPNEKNSRTKDQSTRSIYKINKANINKANINNKNNNNTCSVSDIEEIWTLYPNKKGKAKSIKKIAEIIKKIGKESLICAIKNYSEEVKDKDPQYILYGSSFFNGRYEDYLPENFSDGMKCGNKLNGLNTGSESIDDKKAKPKYTFHLTEI